MDTEEQKDKQVRSSARDALEKVCGDHKVLSHYVCMKSVMLFVKLSCLVCRVNLFSL